MKKSSNPSAPRPRSLVIALAAALAAGVVLAESGTVLKDTQLRNEPLGSADVIAELKAKQGVEITARQGAWAGVRTDAGVEGWARILNLRTSSGQTTSGGGDQLVSAFRTGSRGSSVATAVKGLSAAELMNASPNHSDVAVLDGYATSTSDASQFAAQAPLSSQSVGYLEEEKRGRKRR